MSSSSYWRGQLDYLSNNRPKSSESYYNQSFVDRMNEAQANIDNLVGEQNKSYSAIGQKQDEYDAFSGSMKSYGDVWKSRENEFGVEQAKDNYEESKKAIALAESTMEALPSSINNASNRVLTQEQRENRYNTLSSNVMRQQNMAIQRNSMYEEAWNNAREARSKDVNATIDAQWKQLDEFNNAWLNALNDYTKASERVSSAKNELANIQSDYRNWQYQQWSNALDIWTKEYEAATNRYIQALDTELAETLANITRANADRNAQNAYNNRSYDFGNGYTLKNNNGYAEYYYNGNKIKAGRFLEATGANGANWNLWNSVWNSGIKTTGVGSDTVEAFNRKSSVGYDYLF